MNVLFFNKIFCVVGRTSNQRLQGQGCGCEAWRSVFPVLAVCTWQPFHEAGSVDLSSTLSCQQVTSNLQ